MSPEDMQRFEVEPGHVAAEARMVCLRCFWDMEIPVATVLAELVQRADEHTEVCR